MNDRVFLDTNVLVYVFDDDESAKQSRARALLADADPGTLTVSAQVLGEFFVTVTRKLRRPLGLEDAREAVGWLSCLAVVPIDGELVRGAVRLVITSGVSYWDGLVLASAARAGCSRVISEDLNDGQRYGSVRVQNPFRGLTPG